MSADSVRAKFIADLERQIAERRAEIHDLNNMLVALAKRPPVQRAAAVAPAVRLQPARLQPASVPAASRVAVAKLKRELPRQQRRDASHGAGALTRTMQQLFGQYPAGLREDTLVALLNKRGLVGRQLGPLSETLRAWVRHGRISEIAIDGHPAYRITERGRTMEGRALSYIVEHEDCTTPDIYSALGEPEGEAHGLLAMTLRDLAERGLAKSERRAGTSSIWRCTAAGRRCVESLRRDEEARVAAGNEPMPVAPAGHVTLVFGEPSEIVVERSEAQEQAPVAPVVPPGDVVSMETDRAVADLVARSEAAFDADAQAVPVVTPEPVVEPPAAMLEPRVLVTPLPEEAS